MIEVKPKRTEREYRRLEIDSSSSLKLFCESREDYYKKFVAGTYLEEEETRSSLIGSLVHTLILEPEEFDTKYYKGTGEPPKGIMGEFVELLYKHTIACTTEEGVVTKDFLDIAKAAHSDSSYKIPIDKVLKKFVSSGAQRYYSQLRDTREKNLKVVSEYDMMLAEGITETLKMDDSIIGEVINQETTDDITVFNELKIDGFELYGLPLKGMLDKLIIDHKKKMVNIYDLKIVWEPYDFYNAYYIKRKAHIQAFVYWEMIKWWVKENGYNYNVYPPRYIVADSKNFHKPLLYQLYPDDMNDAWVKVDKAIAELKWAKENNEWRITKEAYEKGRILTLTGR
jgi:hypothetical protein